MNVPLYVLIGFSCLSWLIIMLAIIKFCRYFDEFEKFKARNDIELNNVTWHLKKAEETREKILIELQRASKLLYDLYKGNKVDFYSEVEYSQEDALRHHKADNTHPPVNQHLHNGLGGGTYSAANHPAHSPIIIPDTPPQRPAVENPELTPREEAAASPHTQIKVNPHVMSRNKEEKSSPF